MAVSRCSDLLIQVSLLRAFALASFPNSSDPFALAPPLHTSGRFCGRVALLEDVRLSAPTQIARGTFEQAPCPGPWSSIRLELHGAVRGVQFDRYGALWVGGVEVLRTTTPEPTDKGIRWSVHRDVSDYASLFLERRDVFLSIPNTVTGPYTGVLELNVSVSFYSQPLHQQSEIVVLPVLSGNDLRQDPWSATQVRGQDWQNTILPSVPVRCERLFVDVYASGHECEEFEAGYDCGGPLRRLRVHVDGHPAGIMYPFPVIYTGGVNPLLWRPLTGIASFDVPPYRFDLTAFIPMLTSNSTHELRLTVDHNTHQGVWYLDPVLVCVMGDEPLIGGKLESATLEDDYAPHNVSTHTMLARDRSDFVSRGHLIYGTGEFVVEVRGQFYAYANYTTLGGGGGPTTPPNHRIVEGNSRGRVITTRVGREADTAEFDFPYRVILHQTVNGSGFDMFANVSYGISSASPRAGTREKAVVSARYKRAENRSMLVGENEGVATYSISTLESGTCYAKQVKIGNGSLVDASVVDWACAGELPGDISRRTLPALSTTQWAVQNDMIIFT